MPQISQGQVKWAYVHMDIYVDARLNKIVVKFTKASSDVRKKIDQRLRPGDSLFAV